MIIDISETVRISEKVKCGIVEIFDRNILDSWDI